jgi:hypothetical protein
MMLSCAVDVSCAASKTCRAILKQLLDQDWAAKVLGNLKQLLVSPELQTAAPAAAEGVVYAVGHKGLPVLAVRGCQVLFVTHEGAFGHTQDHISYVTFTDATPSQALAAKSMDTAQTSHLCE